MDFIIIVRFRYLPAQSNSKCMKLKKCIKAYFFISSIIMAIHLPILAVYNYYGKRKVLELLPHFIQGSSVVCLIISMKVKKNVIKKLFRNINKYAPERSRRRISISTVYVLFLGCYITVISIHESVTDSEFKLFLDPYLGLTRNVLFVYVYIMYYVTQFCIPTIVGIIFYAIIKYLVAIISNFEDKLKLNLLKKEFSYDILLNFVKNYSVFSAFILNANAIFSLPMMFVMIMYFTKMFSVMATILVANSFSSYHWLWIDVFNVLIMNVSVTFSICNMANRLKRKMENINNIFLRVNEILLLSRYPDDRCFFLVKHMISKRPLILSAEDVFFFSRKFFVMALGTLVTYGLLFIQVQDKWS